MNLFEQLEHIFHPHGLAIVGASNRPGNLGGFFLQGFIQQGFPPARIYVVHPVEKEVAGLKAYPRVRDIHADIDLVVVFSPREAVPGIVRDCVRKGVTGVVICTSGFAESGGEGEELQREMVETAQGSDTRLIGPNCVGIYCPSSHLVNYAGVMPRESGTVGMFSQSGSLTVMLPIAAAGQGMHFSKVISCGNSCDLNEADFLEYFGQDPETEIIIAYIEGVKDGRRFFDIAREVSRSKPVIVWKGGMSDEGLRSAASHTGVLAGSPQVWDALFRQAGIVRADSEAEFLDLLQAFYYMPLPGGNRVAIISGAGGTGVTIADACMDYGLEVARLSPKTKKKLKGIVPPIGTCIDNPVDLGMMSAFNLQMIADTVKALAGDENVDMIIKTVGVNHPDGICSEIESLEGFDKPIAYVTGRAMRATMEVPAPVKGVAIYTDGRRAAQMLGKMVRYSRYRLGD